MRRTLEIDLEYAQIIESPPMTPDQLYKNACMGDEITIKTWKETWIKNYQLAKDRFGTFEGKTIGQLYNANHHKPIICLASGPSLSISMEALRTNQAMVNPVPVVSVLHNFALLMDEGIKVDYWITLDAGEIVLDDTTEFGKEKKESYWEKTKGQKLLAVIFSPPKLFDLWQGEVFLFNALVPEQEMREKFDAIERCSHYISSGGNAGGGAFYFAKAILGSNPILFCGYDYCFSHDMKWHPVGSKYDNFNGNGAGVTMKWKNVFGLPIKTWGSYLGFKFWHDQTVMRVPGDYINCSEGILGAYDSGIIKHFQYKSLKDALAPYWLADRVILQPTTKDAKPEDFPLAPFYANSKHALNLTLF